MFGEYLRKLREVKGYGLREFAKELGITPTYLSDIERNCRPAPGYELLEKIIEKLDLNQYTKDKLHALAVNDKCNLPPDIVQKIKEHPEIFNMIRNYIGCVPVS